MIVIHRAAKERATTHTQLDFLTRTEGTGDDITVAVRTKLDLGERWAFREATAVYGSAATITNETLYQVSRNRGESSFPG